MPGPLEQTRNAVSERCASSVRDVQRTGGIGGNELDLDALARLRLRLAVTCILAQYLEQLRLQTAMGETEVDEARSGNLGRAQTCRFEIQPFDDVLGKRLRFLTDAFGQDESEIGRKVAVI